MSDQQPDNNEPKVDAAPDVVPDSGEPKPELVAEPQPSFEGAAVESKPDPLSVHLSETTVEAPVKGATPEVEWIPGEQLELIRIPPPTIWPATLALGTTGIAFGVVTHWILSVAGLFLFLLGAAGWIEDLRNDVLQ